MISNYLPSDNKANYASSLANDVYIEIKEECLGFITTAYHLYVADMDKTFHQNEIYITAGIWGKLDKILDAEQLGYKFIYDGKQLTEEMTSGRKTPKKAKMDDIKILLYHLEIRKYIEFDLEAKLLGENPVGSYSVTTLINEYVTKAGMGKFLTGDYKNEGFMLGYILNGKVDKIVNRINLKITTTYSANEHLSEHKGHYLSTYTLGGKQKELHHIFFKFL